VLSCDLRFYANGQVPGAVTLRSAYLLHLAELLVRDEDRAAFDFRGDARYGYDAAAAGAELDFLLVADLQVLGVVAVDFDEALGIVEEQDTVFAL